MVPDVDAGASPSLKPSLGRFALAALLAALAGGIAAFVLGVAYRLNERDALTDAASGSLRTDRGVPSVGSTGCRLPLRMLA